MITLILGLFIFFAMHLVPSFTGFRQSLILKMGEGLYKGLYSLVSLSGIILIIYGMSITEFRPIWNPPAWSRDVVIITMLFSFYLFAAADMKSNIKRFIRHPMLLGVVLWAGAHLIANGDLASILLFGAFAVFSLFDMVSANLRGATRQEKVYPITRDVITVIAGLVAYGVFLLFIHPYLIGVSIV